MTAPLAKMRITCEEDVMVARRLAQRIGVALEMDPQDRTRIATAVSEITRNAYRYAGGGEVAFWLDNKARPPLLSVVVTDTGPGIADLDRVLSGGYRSSTGMGMGLRGTRRIMDTFQVRSEVGAGTVVSFGKHLPAERDEEGVRAAIASVEPDTALERSRDENRELLTALADLTTAKEALAQTNVELMATNDGIISLYHELETQADELRRANEGKSRFLSMVTHELRTPANSILGLTKLIASREELAQDVLEPLSLITDSAQHLTKMVDDLLDAAKAESGQLDTTMTDVDIVEVANWIVASLQPLAKKDVALVVGAPEHLPHIRSDADRIAQILRNLVGNALKFTSRGEVRIELDLDGPMMLVRVCDTGVGIPEEALEQVFLEFEQVRGPHQLGNKGTGLGLPIARRIARLLGGDITVASRPDVGTTFTVALPIPHEVTLDHDPEEVGHGA